MARKRVVEDSLCVRTAVSLDEDTLRIIREAGGGNVSLGVRRVAAGYDAVKRVGDSTVKVDALLSTV
jgi:hypothetical protein